MTPCKVSSVGANRRASAPRVNVLREVSFALQVVYRLSHLKKRLKIKAVLFFF
jgi:hypothetical protein